MSKSGRYHRISQTLHWFTALLVLVMYVTGWGREFMDGDLRKAMMPIHKSVGITIIILTLGRLGWRFFQKPPAYAVPMPRILHRLSQAAHWALYGFLIAIPTLGWLLISAADRPMLYLGVIDLPLLIGKNPELRPVIGSWHVNGAIAMFVVIAAHAIAACFHQFVLKDRLIDRMLPAGKNS